MSRMRGQQCGPDPARGDEVCFPDTSLAKRARHGRECHNPQQLARTMACSARNAGVFAEICHDIQCYQGGNSKEPDESDYSHRRADQVSRWTIA